ncbi:MAG: ImmA/IrrE family metallo-endopeptidase [Candidatus Nitrohelix vancouverensis]|uniref:ImmA/IrrE family metallo-endopeptidase n=1 Tax=Candidatus Nitrohelix vancouverensis TaxID=2705534 RepID=A0A7T0G4U2_9BACT|nr:MAG: ImmA/IrrE family metallo-endopeptidase [Candidatus Nitrohelix vancouverensis]
MPKINQEILIWARETSGLTVEEAAKKLQLKDTSAATGVEKLLEYESGKEPSRSLLVKMSKQYRKPLLAFYLEKPPRKGDRGEDFRTLREGYKQEENVLVDVLIRDIKARQSVLREILIEEDEAEALPFIGCTNRQQGISNIANMIRQTLNFNLGEFRGNRDPDDAFKYLRNIAEEIGIFVLLAGNLGSHHSNIDTEIFRGFVLADKIAPFIVINDQDSKSAWSFTLLHEIAHLLLGQTGVSGSFSENMVEQFCNDVASEILLPSDELNDFKPDILDFEKLTQQISSFSKERNISSSLVSYRLLRKSYINQRLWTELSKFYEAYWRDLKTKERKRNKQQKGGPSYFVLQRKKLGNALVRIAERMMLSGALTTTKAGLLLGVRPIKVHKLFHSGRAV